MDPLFIILGIIVLLVAIYYIGTRVGRHLAQKEHEEQIILEREDAIKRSRAVLSGQFSEQLAPFLPNFPYKPTEARFIGKPIDFIVFKGMDEKKVDEVVFVEVKSGSSTLSTHERRLRDTINEKKVRWEEYSIPQELTKKKEN
jgi:predicted Holliday junction resolvase-like endonuclease